MTSVARWKAVEDQIQQFRSFLAPSVPSFKVMHAVDRQWSDDEYNNKKPEGFPFNSRGVYLIYGGEGTEELLYVGSATKNYASRVFMHDEKIERRHIDIIPFEEKYLSLSVALEFFLISRLRPPGNSSYKQCIVIEQI